MGQSLQALAPLYPAYHLHTATRQDLDIQDTAAINALIKTEKITAIINTAAYTAVDQAETDYIQANAVNRDAVANLAQVAKENGCSLMHLSTDYVFAGTATTPYKENDPTAPLNAYAKSKLAGEIAMQACAPVNSCIVRTSWVYSPFGSNFVKTMLALGQTRSSIQVVNDQYGSPTYALDLANALLTLLPTLHSRTVSLFHYCNTGVITWHTFAKAIMKHAGLDCSVAAIPTSGYPTAAKRPTYSALDTQRIQQQTGLTIPNWEESLKTCFFHINHKKQGVSS